MLHATLILEVLVLLAVANGSPIAAKRIMADYLAQPLDGGLMWFDNRPLFGKSKTIRGITVSIASTTLAAILIGAPWSLGFIVGTTSMAGDLLSSFTKRRLGLAQSARATGLDQIPESLLPALACMPLLGLTGADVAAIVLVFFAGSVILSRWLHRLGFRDQPH
jgi:CDP-diglyceride synthetase